MLLATVLKFIFGPETFLKKVQFQLSFLRKKRFGEYRLSIYLYSVCIYLSLCTDAVNQPCLLLIGALCQRATADNLESLFINYVLIYMGMLKSEDNSLKPVTQLSGPFIALDYAVRHQHLSNESKLVVRTFIDKSKANLVERHALLQALYQ